MSDDSAAATETARHDPYAVLREKNFRLYLTGNVLSLVGTQMQAMALAWEIYARTHSKMALGAASFIGWLPVISLALFTGHVADRVPRKRIITRALLVSAMASFGLASISVWMG